MDWIGVGFKLDRFQQRKIRRYVISGKTFNDIEFVLLQFNSELSWKDWMTIEMGQDTPWVFLQSRVNFTHGELRWKN